MDSTSKHTSRKRWLRLAVAAAPVLLLWGIPEIVVRLANPMLQQYRATFFGGDPNSPVLFMQDPRLHWKLRPGVDVEFRGVRVRTNADGFRGHELARRQRNILCLGDSTTFGWRVAESECFPAILEQQLAKPTKGEASWQVVNAGVSGYSSHQMRLRCRELLRSWQPEVVIVCAGNNEAWPAEQSDRTIDESRRWTVRFERLLSCSRFALWLKEKLNPQRAKPFIAEPRSGASQRVSVTDYADNIREIIRSASRQHARVIVMEPPVNLFKPPFVSRQLPDAKLWVNWCREVLNEIETDRIDAAMSAAEAQLKTRPGNVYALWMKGYATAKTGRLQEGLELLENALEVHPFPESCRRSYREVLAGVAREENADYLAVNELLRATGSQEGGPASLYLDHCHPTPEGHRLIAMALRDLIQTHEGADP